MTLSRERLLKIEKFISQDIHVSLGQRVTKAILSVTFYLPSKINSIFKLNKSITWITHSTSPGHHLHHLYRHYSYPTNPHSLSELVLPSESELCTCSESIRLSGLMLPSVDVVVLLFSILVLQKASPQVRHLLTL